MSRSPSRPVALVAATLLLLSAACSGKITEDGSGGSAAGPGVTDSMIRLGVLTDNTGAFAGPGKANVQGIQVFWEEKNRSGGICGRQIELLIRDHGYNVQNAVSMYAEMQPEVLAFQHLLGSPMSAALTQSTQSDQVLAVVASWAQNLLENPYYILPGTSYDVEMANGLAWLARTRDIPRGEPVGHVYLEGEYGESALAGSKAAAADLGLRLVEQRIQSADADLSVQVAALRDAGARYVLLTATPSQVASALSAAAAANYGMTFVGSGPTFNPTLLNGAARNAFETTFFVAGSTGNYASEAKGPSEVRRLFEAKFPDEPRTTSVTFGYGQAQIMAAVLEEACEAGALNRPGMLEAFQSITNLETDGVLAPLNYSRRGESPATKVFITRPDKDTPGGLELVQDLVEYPEAANIRHG